MGPVEPAVELTMAGTPGCLTRSQHACLATPASVVRHGARRWVPEDVLSELDRRARARGKDRATLLGELLRAALDRDKEDEVVAAYRSGHLSLSAGRRATRHRRMVVVRYPRAEGRDGERVAGGLEGLWIVAVRPALTSRQRNPPLVLDYRRTRAAAAVAGRRRRPDAPVRACPRAAHGACRRPRRGLAQAVRGRARGAGSSSTSPGSPTAASCGATIRMRRGTVYPCRGAVRADRRRNARDGRQDPLLASYRSSKGPRMWSSPVRIGRPV